jgi:hypothetical protein
MPNPPVPSSNRSVRAYLDRLERERFYGVLSVRYENGNAVHIRREESILPANLPTEIPNHEQRNQQ